LRQHLKDRNALSVPSSQQIALGHSYFTDVGDREVRCPPRRAIEHDNTDRGGTHQEGVPPEFSPGKVPDHPLTLAEGLGDKSAPRRIPDTSATVVGRGGKHRSSLQCAPDQSVNRARVLAS